MLNVETIDGKIIEMHLRSTSQWPDLYNTKTWQYKPNIDAGYSVVLFDESIPFAAHSMPPGGFRLAIINGFCLDSCLSARDAIHQEYNRIN